MSPKMFYLQGNNFPILIFPANIKNAIIPNHFITENVEAQSMNETIFCMRKIQVTLFFRKNRQKAFT